MKIKTINIGDYTDNINQAESHNAGDIFFDPTSAEALVWDGTDFIPHQGSISHYEMAFNKFAHELKEKGLPDLQDIMDHYMKDHPEYLL